LGQAEAQWVGSLRQGSSDWEQMLGSLARLYVRGVEVDWAGFDKDCAWRRTSLPTYPFQRERYWVERPRGPERAATAGAGTHRLLGRRISSPVLKETVFESSVSTGALAFLEDHRVHGAAVLPATVYMEMARAAATELFGAGAHAVEELLIHEALVLHGDEVRTLQLILTPRGDDTLAFQLFSARGDAWRLHAAGTLLKAQQSIAAPEPLSLDGLLARCAQEVPAATLYEYFQARGISYGPGFRGVERVRLGRGEALGRIQLPESLASDEVVASIHPALLDACLQLCGAVRLEEDARASEDMLYLPVGLRRLTVWRAPGTACWSHVSLQPQQPMAEGTLTGNVRLLDEAGAVCAELEGLRFQRVSRSALRRMVGTGNDWAYEVRWEPRSRSGLPEGAALHGTWVLLADAEGLGAALAKSLEARGARCVLARPGSAYEARDGRTFTLDPARVEDFARMLQEAEGTSGQPCAGVVHLWGLDGGGEEPAARDVGCKSALHLVQALGRTGAAVPPRLWVVTRGTQRTGHERFVPALTHSALWGFGRTLATEHPDLWGALLDLDSGPRESDLALLTEEFLRAPDGEQVAYRNGRRYVARLVRCTGLDARPSASRFRQDASYLLTGGLGAIGLHVARWMVERGARHLVLMGRKEASDAARDALRSLREAGANIQWVQGDVSRADDVARVLATIARSGPPLRGVMHVAGVVEDGMLLQQDWPRFERVLAPKQQGSWNLHHQTKDLELDFFVLFSSSASLLGAAGQANYAAANAFMDALAHHRRALGLPAVSINWGPWSGGGMAASLHVPEQRRWFDWIEPEQGLELLGWVLEAASAQVAVLPIEWTKYVQRFGDAGASKLLEQPIDEARAGRPRATVTPMLERLKGLPRHRQQETLLEHVHHQVAQVLGLDASKPIPDNQGLFDSGLDSLMAVELRNRLQASLGLERPLSATLVFEHPTIESLTHHLATEVFALGPLVSGAEKSSGNGEAPDTTLAELEQLPQDELGAMLDQKLASLEKLMGGN
ncbi:SDR family NAD(P)-dependent oxidoreductase, partial [Pyxidicoccus fallax]